MMIGDVVAQSEAPTEAVKPGDIVTNPDLARMRERQRRIETLSALFARQNRVYRIGYRLLYAAVDMCPDRLRVAVGFTYANAYLFQGSVRTAATAMGYTHRVSVVDVAANGAAARAGIQARDVFMKIDGWPVPYGEGAVTLAAAKLRDTLTREGRALLEFRRGSSPYSVTIKPNYICDYRVLAVPGAAIKAYADGDQVVVFQGLLEFVGDDDDHLASVIAREIANNLIPTMNIEADDGKSGLANFFYWGMEPEASGDPTADQARAVDHRIAADYVGAYLLARAGFDHAKAPEFWYRLANAEIGGQGQNYPAPDPEYLLQLEATVDELDRKLAARQPLRPEPGGPPPADPDALIMLAKAPPAATPVEEPRVADDDGSADQDDAPETVILEAPAIDTAVSVAGLPWTAETTTVLPAAAGQSEVAAIDDLPWRDPTNAPETRSMRDAFGEPESDAVATPTPIEEASVVTVEPLDPQSLPARAAPMTSPTSGFSFHDWFGG